MVCYRKFSNGAQLQHLLSAFGPKDLYKSGLKAQERLSLGGAPTHRLEFQILNKPNFLRNGTKVTPIPGQQGLGSEFMTLDPVKIQLINVQPLR